MGTHSRARRLALTALCAGTSLGAVGLVALPGSALAAPDQVAAAQACSNVFSSGSTLQNVVQQQTWTPNAANDGAFSAACTNTPSAYYNTDVNGNPLGGTGSGAGLTEFALQAPAGGTAAVTPTASQNGQWLDGFVGSDDPPTPAAMQTAASAAASAPQPVPVIQAPIAIVVHLPAGCTVKKAPTFRNADLSAAFANTSTDKITWTKLLKDAGAGPVGCGTASPIVQVRFDGSGTSYATKQYLSQIDASTWGPYVSDAASWPGTVSTTYVDANGNTDPDQGSGGEAAAVANTVGSIGYVNTANAVSAGFGGFSAGDATFWVKVQNNGVATTGTVTGAGPLTSSKAGNCPTAYSGALPAGSEPDWTGVHVANPKQVTSTVYPLCTLTFDIAWQSYASSSVLAPDYTGLYAGETPAGVGAATKAYLKWELSTAALTGQALVPAYYSKLPSTVDTAAAKIVAGQVALN